MDTTDLYNIKDGDSGKTVADGLKANFEGIIADVKNRVEKVDGKGLSTNDYTNEEKQKVAGAQPKTDESLQTEAKTVPDAINELVDTLGDISTILDDINGEAA